MRGKIVAIFSAAAGLLLFSSGSSAHHGVYLVYDVNQKVTTTGTVTDFQFVNPHVLVFFDVTGEDGAVVEWWAGLTNPNHLARGDGWTADTLKPGDHISVTGAPAKNDVPTMWAEQIFLDGEPLLIELAGWKQLLEIGVR